jgi:transglutaminase-like putative cysteine protease
MRDPARQESERRSRASSKERAKGKPRFSIDAHHERAFPYFLAAAVSLAVVGACIGDGLHPLVLLFLPVTMAALLRRDYRRPVFFSERVTGRLLAGYVILLSIGVAIAAGRLRLPLSLVYLTTGTIFLCALLPLSDRCITQLIILTVGLVLLNCILTNHVLYALILACYLFALMGALVSFHLARSRPAPWAIAADTGGPAKSPASRGNLGLYLLIILAVTAVTFPFMPRPFTLPPGLKAEMSATTRLRNPNRPLSCSGMTGSGGTRIAFLVRFPGQPPPGPYYWRSRVLVRTDGKNWYPSTTTAPGVARARLNSRKTFTYEISPFGLRSNRVCTLGTPTRALDGEKHRLPVTAQGEVVINNLTFLSESYTVRAIPGSLPVGPGMGLRFLDSGGTTSRIRNLARQWTRGATTRRGKAYMVLSYLGKGYGYTLQIPAIPAGVHSLEYFLFQSRAGNSAHFAGAAVLLLRSVRVPCRMVQGFLGMEKTDVPNEYVVRFSNAHVWVEVLLGDGQWTTFDPSPASARCAPRHR